MQRPQGSVNERPERAGAGVPEPGAAGISNRRRTADGDHHGAAGAKRSRITAVAAVVAHLPPEQAAGLAAAERPAKRPAAPAGASAIATAVAPQEEAPESQSSGSHGGSITREVTDGGELGNVAAHTARGPVAVVTRVGDLPTAFKVCQRVHGIPTSPSDCIGFEHVGR